MKPLLVGSDQPPSIAMPPKRRMAAAKLRWATARKERDEEEPDDEPEVELEEPEEEPTELEPFPRSWNEWFQFRMVRRVRDAIITWKYAAAMWKIDKEVAERDAVQEAEEKAQEEEEEKKRLELLELHEVVRLREQQQRAACANGCVCVCAYGGSRKRDFSAMGSPLVSRNVSTFNANV